MKKLKMIVVTLFCCGLYIASSLADSKISTETEKTQVIIIGTLHEFHYNSQKYSPEVLRKIILDLKPDAILNELPLSLVDPNGRPIEKIRGENNSGGPESWAADTVAQHLGIKQIPFDRPDRNAFYRKTNYFKRQKEYHQELNKWFDGLYTKEPNSIEINTITLINEAITAQGLLLGSQNLITPKHINSQLYDSVIKIKHSSGFIVPKILKKHSAPQSIIDEAVFFRDVWLERNKTMANNILKASKEYKRKRLVVITGSDHRYILRDLLKDEESINLKEYWEVLEPNKVNSEKDEPKEQKTTNTSNMTTTEKTQIIILGTIHSAHHKNPNYSPEILKEILLSLKPDAILNELPLSLVDRNGRPIEIVRSKESSCPEMWAADTVATELGIKQIPFDRPDREEYYTKTNYFKRGKQCGELRDMWLEQISKDAPESIAPKISLIQDYAGQAHHHFWLTAEPEYINSTGLDSIEIIKDLVWEEILPGLMKKEPKIKTLLDEMTFLHNEWQERNRIMADNIVQAAQRYHGKRLVVLTGATHRYIGPAE